MMMPRKTSTNPASAADAPRMVITTSLGSTTAVLRSCRRQPGLHEVVDERVIAPLRDLVAERVDVLDRPVPPAVRPRVDAGSEVCRPGECLDGLVAVAVAGAVARLGR